MDLIIKGLAVARDQEDEIMDPPPHPQVLIDPIEYIILHEIRRIILLIARMRGPVFEENGIPVVVIQAEIQSLMRIIASPQISPPLVRRTEKHSRLEHPAREIVQ